MIENNRIFDNNGSASYNIDIPNGGNVTVTGNQIEQGPNTQNPYMMTYGVEGESNPGTDVVIADNTIVNDLGGGGFLLNATSVAPAFTDNQVFGLTDGQLSPKGPPLDESGTVFLGSRPSLDTSSLSFINPPAGSSPPDPPPAPPPAPPPEPPPPTPPIFTPDQITAWQNLVFTDFVSYATAGNVAVAFDPNAQAALGAEMNDPLLGTGGIPSAAVWGPFQT